VNGHGRGRDYAHGLVHDCARSARVHDHRDRGGDCDYLRAFRFHVHVNGHHESDHVLHASENVPVCYSMSRRSIKPFTDNTYMVVMTAHGKHAK
jgi:hypothetical protein